ncbi:auxin response factor 18 [Phtheirospermum japonicum]|uniref:Auxin response factor n=1 Tax=Phtheirospermum japonicum TaxID=374723 RepID=A0A830CG03_9LAMI|nr:auxin response factor 18 [Phtheirospermum japonicum]
MAQIPPPNSKVYYFPQGHAEHANNIIIDLNKFPRSSPLIPCKVSSIKYLADTESDEVYAKIRLVPLSENECDNKNDEKGKNNSFAKTLTQSDANNGGGFSVPRYCAETIFPRLDYSAEPPVQTILVKDVHGQIWKFRHIYRGTPRRHLLTTGWSNFINKKKLVAGDSIVFLRAENGDLCFGVRRAKRGIGGGPEVLSGWNTAPANFGPRGFGFSCFLSESGNNMSVGKKNNGDLRDECVFEAVSLAASGQPFEVVYYPRASTPEFVVRQSAVRAAMRVRWCSGMRFKMAFETEDSSRISWFMGTISSVHVEDPIRWPNSPWRLLQVAWDEPDLLQNVKRVCPWLVELVSSVPANFSPPRKRPRHHISTLLTNPLSPSSPLCCLDNVSAGVQGARHARFGPSDLHFKNLQMGLQPFDFKLLNDVKAPTFVLFGQPILTAEQISRSHSVDTEGNSLSDGNQENVANVSSNGSESAISQNFPAEPTLDWEFPRCKDYKLDLISGTGHCKVFVESEDVGRTLDLSILGSYEEMYRKLAAMFGVERSEMLGNYAQYSDAQGTTKHIGDEIFR